MEANPRCYTVSSKIMTDEGLDNGSRWVGVGEVEDEGHVLNAVELLFINEEADSLVLTRGETCRRIGPGRVAGGAQVGVGIVEDHWRD